ncbi:hypothetical protein AYI68_g3040 [Smittium mucronatum]|uniref:Peptidase S1 domain-containing protein n=1 Tax=Smittium mucronatum TaxID=133383 RepID=A0A1R0H117_9FUNG|nr:hypothetical protein AYI68_g3040 [Smittium mucronatum]
MFIFTVLLHGLVFGYITKPLKFKRYEGDVSYNSVNQPEMYINGSIGKRESQNFPLLRWPAINEYIINIYVVKNDDDYLSITHQCLGILYKGKYAITSASCIQNDPVSPSEYYVKDPTVSGFSTLRIKKIHVHLKFDSKLPLKYNIAILEFNKEIKLKGFQTIPSTFNPNNHNLYRIAALQDIDSAEYTYFKSIAIHKPLPKAAKNKACINYKIKNTVQEYILKGAPVFADKDSQVQILGIHSGMRGENQNTGNELAKRGCFTDISKFKMWIQRAELKFINLHGAFANIDNRFENVVYNATAAFNKTKKAANEAELSFAASQNAHKYAGSTIGRFRRFVLNTVVEAGAFANMGIFADAIKLAYSKAETVQKKADCAKKVGIQAKQAADNARNAAAAINNAIKVTKASLSDYYSFDAFVDSTRKLACFDTALKNMCSLYSSTLDIELLIVKTLSFANNAFAATKVANAATDEIYNSGLWIN